MDEIKNVKTKKEAKKEDVSSYGQDERNEKFIVQ
jgi:hypothetical protein